MAVGMQYVPSDVRLPLFYAEVDPSMAGSKSIARKTLIFGQKISTGSAAVNTPVKVRSATHADWLFQRGSQLARSCYAYFLNDSLAEVWAMSLADADGAAKAVKILNITGPATESGEIAFYIAGQPLSVPVTASDNGTTIGARFQSLLGVDEAAAVVLKSSYPVTAASFAGAVTFTARNAGNLGNRIDLRVNWATGEALPAGVAITELTGVTHVKLATGATDPTLTTAITNMLEQRWSYVVCPWALATILDAFKAEFADNSSGRWGPIRQLYGRVFTAEDDAYGTLSTTFASGVLNSDPHSSCLSTDAAPTPPWEGAAMFAGRIAASTRIDPARPANTLELIGFKAPHPLDRLIWSELDALLRLGQTVPTIDDDGTVRIARWVSTWTTDTGFLDGTTETTLDLMLTEMRSMVVTKFGRMKLVDDGTEVGPGQPIVMPSMIRSALIAQYRGWVRRGLCENAAAFARLIIVERSLIDPNRVDVLFPPDLANALHIFAVLAQFRLQYSELELAA